MKMQLGLLHLTDQVASREDRVKLLGALAQRSFETSGEVFAGPLLMAYRGDRITFEEESEIQPFPQRPYILTWDGRLDNREEIAKRTGIRDSSRLPDSAIVLKAIKTVGEGVVSDLIGEFALTLWSELDRSLLFARSACGARPLYYVVNQDRLIWCSSFAHLVRVTSVDLTVRDEYVIQYLVTTPDTKITPLANVHAIPPNRIVRFKNGQMHTGRELWNPLRIAPLRYRTDDQYEEHCREAVTEAVKARLRSKVPVYAELSGGLDSSTVVLTADRILRDQNHSPCHLQTVSCVYEQSKSADERSFIRAVEEKREIATHFIHEVDQEITVGLEDQPSFTGLPHTLHCFPGRYQVISKLMEASNAGVLLTGRGGDHLFWSPQDGSAIVADQLCKLNLVRAYRECGIWSRGSAVTYYELLTRRAPRLAFGSMVPSKGFYEKPKIPTWVHPRHQSAMRCLSADFEGFTEWHALPSRRAQVFAVDRMFRMLGSGLGEEYPEIYASHPYSHRPLVEFCLATPLSQFLRNGQPRSLMRRAFRDLLPKKVANRVSKGLVDETILRALQREQAPVSNPMNWQVCERGYAFFPALADALRQARLGLLDLSGPLIRLLSLERWLRSLGAVRGSLADPLFAVPVPG
jgi:asparagine synthase (glutamine-hydrolysing)